MSDKSDSAAVLQAIQEAGGLVTTKQAARYLNVSVSSIGKLRDEGAFPFYKMGTIVRFKKDDLDSFLATCAMTFGDNNE